MNTTIQPWQLLLTALAGLMNQEQQQIIEYLQEENKVLKEHLKGKRILVTALIFWGIASNQADTLRLRRYVRCCRKGFSGVWMDAWRAKEVTYEQSNIS